ncbi:MAG: hypothetical protein HYX63_07130 [Gammaproteobacteria bacterium]|nr:hypothetical protein [Gammaproteobacteria bacterium]
MHSPRYLLGIMMMALAVGGALAADTTPHATAPPASAPAASPPDPERPEYRARALPTDSFNPSEQMSEDYPVPFPADI